LITENPILLTGFINLYENQRHEKEKNKRSVPTLISLSESAVRLHLASPINEFHKRFLTPSTYIYGTVIEVLSIMLRQGLELKIVEEYERFYKELRKACKEGNKERIVSIAMELLKTLDNIIILGNPEAVMYKCSDSMLDLLLMFSQFMILILFLPEEAKMHILIRPPIAFEIHTTFPI
jgi:hypothetical protein